MTDTAGPTEHLLDEQLHCPQCAAVIEATWRVCPYCDEKLALVPAEFGSNDERGLLAQAPGGGRSVWNLLPLVPRPPVPQSWA